MFIDSHTHLFSKEFDSDRSSIINQAIELGVKSFILPNIDLESVESVLNLANSNKNCFATLGIHPCSITKTWEQDLHSIRNYILNNQIVAIGEIGIDLYWDKSLIVEQKLAFEQQIIWAKEFKKPIIIHVREAFNEVFEIIDRQNDDNLRGVFHCFTGNQAQLEKCLSYKGFYIGIGGVVTFKNGGINKILHLCPLNRMLIETDSPYLAPTPHRGKRNESSYIPLIAETISDILSLPLIDIAKATTENAIDLFGEDIYE
jgi:TatD DNase family protein